MRSQYHHATVWSYGVIDAHLIKHFDLRFELDLAGEQVEFFRTEKN